MTLPQPLGNNQIERLPDRLIASVTKDPFSARVPETNDPVAVGGDDGVRTRRQDRFGKQIGLSETLHSMHSLTLGYPRHLEFGPLVRPGSVAFESDRHCDRAGLDARWRCA